MVSMKEVKLICPYCGGEVVWEIAPYEPEEINGLDPDEVSDYFGAYICRDCGRYVECPIIVEDNVHQEKLYSRKGRSEELS